MELSFEDKLLLRRFHWKEEDSGAAWTGSFTVSRPTANTREEMQQNWESNKAYLMQIKRIIARLQLLDITDPTTEPEPGFRRSMLDTEFSADGSFMEVNLRSIGRDKIERLKHAGMELSMPLYSPEYSRSYASANLIFYSGQEWEEAMSLTWEERLLLQRFNWHRSDPVSWVGVLTLPIAEGTPIDEIYTNVRRYSDIIERITQELKLIDIVMVRDDGQASTRLEVNMTEDHSELIFSWIVIGKDKIDRLHMADVALNNNYRRYPMN